MASDPAWTIDPLFVAVLEVLRDVSTAGLLVAEGLGSPGSEDIVSIAFVRGGEGELSSV
jgi:hypothetical protein